MDETRLRRALTGANVPALVGVLFQLTGDDRWLRPPYAPRRAVGMDNNTDGGLPPEIQAEIRAAVADAVLSRSTAIGDRTAVRPEPPAADAAPRCHLTSDNADVRLDPPAAVPRPDGDTLTALLSAVMGEPVPAEFGPLMAETIGLTTPPARVPARRAVDGFSVIVIGAGFSGLAASIALRRAGIDHVVLEKNADIGGTWLENRYPGAGVDTPSYLYSLSYFPRAWSTHFGKRDEVHGYLRDLAEAYDLWERVRLGVEVTAAEYDPAGQRWHVHTAAGETLTASAVITGVGQLNRPSVPDLPGLDTFDGPLFHSARWPDDLDLTGKRVAVVGTGASAMQIVPAVAADVAALTIFQRSPQWIAPNADYFETIGADEHWLLEHLPYYRGWNRARLAWTFNDKVHPSLHRDPSFEHPDRAVNAINDAHRRFFTRYLDEQLAGRPDLRAKSLPGYPPFGKRMLLDNGWFAALRRDNVELVTEAVTEITPTGPRSADGRVTEVDVVVMCTGFNPRKFLYPMEFRGRSGRSLREVWGAEDASAHLGITVPDFPNLFIMLGPNTGLGHGGSVLTILEYQLRYIVDLLCTMIEDGVGAVECRQDTHDAYRRQVDDAHEHMIWTHPGMTNWYRNAAGRVVCTLPWRIVDYRAMTLRASPSDFVLEPAPPSADRTPAHDP